MPLLIHTPAPLPSCVSASVLEVRMRPALQIILFQWFYHVSLKMWMLLMSQLRVAVVYWNAEKIILSGVPKWMLDARDKAVPCGCVVHFICFKCLIFGLCLVLTISLILMMKFMFGILDIPFTLKVVTSKSLLTHRVLITRSTRSLQSYCRNKSYLSILYGKSKRCQWNQKPAFGIS